MNIFIAIALGGAMGALSRYWVLQWAARWLGNEAYWGTLLINVMGSMLLGLIYGWSARQHWPSGIEPLLTTGFLGALTTYSTFSVDLVKLLQADRWWEASLYALLTTFLSVAAALLAARSVQ